MLETGATGVKWGMKTVAPSVATIRTLSKWRAVLPSVDSTSSLTRERDGKLPNQLSLPISFSLATTQLRAPQPDNFLVSRICDPFRCISAFQPIDTSMIITRALTVQNKKEPSIFLKIQSEHRQVISSKFSKSFRGVRDLVVFYAFLWFWSFFFRLSKTHKALPGHQHN